LNCYASSCKQVRAKIEAKVRFINKSVAVEARISAESIPEPSAFVWDGRRYTVADVGRTWMEQGARCFLVMTPAQEVYELRQLPDGGWRLARGPEQGPAA